MKNKILVVGFITLIFFFPIYSLISKDKDISYLERRKLSSIPQLSMNAILDGDYFEELNDYVVDQFPYRDSLRTIKGTINQHFLNKKMNNNVFIKDDYIYQLDTHINEKSIKHFTDLLNKVKTNHFKNHQVYYSIIPDKNYYLKDQNIPKLDYQKMFKQVHENLSDDFRYIDITKSLQLDSYYKTDIHWTQEKLKPVVNQISQSMNINIHNYPTEVHTYKPFYGALYGRMAHNIEPDTLTYLTNDIINQLDVYNYEKDKYEKVYEEDNLKHIDSYDIYLLGPTPLLQINNPNQNNGKELIIFRDSFASSLIPLLAEDYSHITVVDLRYYSSDLLKDIDLSLNADVLFLYSTPIINNSFTLK